MFRSLWLRLILFYFWSWLLLIDAIDKKNWLVYFQTLYLSSNKSFFYTSQWFVGKLNQYLIVYILPYLIHTVKNFHRGAWQIHQVYALTWQIVKNWLLHTFFDAINVQWEAHRAFYISSWYSGMAILSKFDLSYPGWY